MTTDPTYTKLLSLVCQEPEEHHHKVVLSDWLEGRDPELSEAWLWMASEGKRPSRNQLRPWKFYWSNEWKRHKGKAGYLPHHVFFRLDDWRVGYGSSGGCSQSRSYETISDAYEAAADAYVTARRTGWRPEVRT